MSRDRDALSVTHRAGAKYPWLIRRGRERLRLTERQLALLPLLIAEEKAEAVVRSFTEPRRE